MDHKPSIGEYAAYYQPYIEKVPAGDFLYNLRSVHHETQEILSNLSEAKGNYRYEEGKWSIKEIMMHLIDTEQIFAYRALSIARGDQTELPGFDQNSYAEAVDVSNRSVASLAEEFAITRDFSHVMFKNFNPDFFTRIGIANGNKTSVRAIAYMILGHELHHIGVLKERYLK